MKKYYITRFRDVIFLVTVLIIFPFENGLSKAIFKEGATQRLIFNPAVSSEGQEGDIQKPGTLKVFETADEQDMGRRVFSNYVRAHIDSLVEKRRSELALLKTPDDWRARQKQIREQLHRYFGEFPEKTPLNAKTVGKLDREGYIIEKVIFESQPNYYVSANLYVPKGRKFPLPGVVFHAGTAMMPKQGMSTICQV